MMGYEKIACCPRCKTKNGEYDMPPPIMLATYGKGMVGIVCNKCNFEGPKSGDSVTALILWQRLPRNTNDLKAFGKEIVKQAKKKRAG